MVKKRSRRAFLRRGAGLAAATGLVGRFSNPEASAGHLFVYNSRETPQRVRLRVTRSPEADGETVIGGVYWIPPGYVLRFDGVLHGGTRYSIHARLPNGPPVDSMTITADTCDENDPSGRMDVRVRVARTVAIVPFRRNRTYTRRKDAQYVDLEKYRVGDIPPSTSA